MKSTRKAKPKGNGRLWKKGQSGNPRGRAKKGATWAELSRRLGGMTPAEVAGWIAALGKRLPKADATLRELAVLSAYVEAINDPNPRMLVALRETEEGRLPEAVQLSGDIDKPVTVRVVYEDDPIAPAPSDAAAGQG